jgi:hypothetical protein
MSERVGILDFDLGWLPENTSCRLHQSCDGLLGEGEDIGRKDSHIKRPDDGQDQSNH